MITKKATFGVIGLACVLGMPGTVCGQSWTSGGFGGSSVASSTDGGRILAAGGRVGSFSFFTSIYLSTNGGTGWAISGSGSASRVACSTDGQVLFGVGSNGGWVTTNGGTTWFQSLYGSYVGCAMSGNGKTLVAFPVLVVDQFPPFNSYPTQFAVSTNYGVNWWTASVPFSSWGFGAISSNGNVLFAGGIAGMYRSTNSGANWSQLSTPTPNDSGNSTLGIASTRDGRCVVGIFGAGIFNPPGYLPYPGFKRWIYTSTNSGASWVSNSVPVTNWNAVAISDDGVTLAAVYGAYLANSGPSPLPTVGGIYTSGNAGANWEANSVPITNWLGCAVSGDGNQVVASMESGQVFIRRPSLPPPQLSLVNSALSVSWPTSAVEVVLQQSADIGTASWVDITNATTVTNGQNVIQLAPTGSQGYFRLRR